MVATLLLAAPAALAVEPSDGLERARRLWADDRPDEALTSALAEARHADDRVAARALLLAGRIEASLEHPDRAIDLLRQSAGRAERAGDAATLRESLEHTGAQALVSGRPGLAVDALRRHLALVQTMPDSRFLGRGLGLMGLALQKVGQYEAALSHYRRCAEYYAERGIVVGEIGALLNIGTLEGEWLRRFADAERSFRRTLELAEGRDDVPPEMIGVTRLNLAEAISDAGRPAEALAHVEAATALFERIAHRPYGARAAVTTSKILLRLGDPRRADVAARTALELAREAGDLDVSRLAHLRRGHALTALDRAGEALAQFEAAATALEELRRDIGIEEMQISFLRDKRDTYEAWIAQLHRMHQREATAGWDGIALRASEASRCRSFIDHLPRRAGTAPPPEPLGPDEMRRLVGPGRVLLEYFFGSERAWLFVVTRDAIAFLDLGSAGDLVDRIAFATGDLRSGRAPLGGPALARRLVLDPLGGALSDASLVVVPDGPLFGLPIEALLAAAGLEPPPVAYVPSATVLAWTARDEAPAAQPTLLAVGVGDPGIEDPTRPPQRLASREAQRASSFFDEAARTLLVDGARESVVRDALRRPFDVVHFAAHARVDEQDPGRGGLLLAASGDAAASAEDDDGLLSAREVAQLAIDARLVVLSGCTTSGNEIAPGEGVLGLSRSFLRAGAATLLVTLWDVSDTAAYELTGRFYGEAARGVPLDSALQRTRRALAHLPDARAFVLVGDGRTVVHGLRRPVPARRLASVGLILAGVVLAALAWRARNRARG